MATLACSWTTYHDGQFGTRVRPGELPTSVTTPSPNHKQWQLLLSPETIWWVPSVVLKGNLRTTQKSGYQNKHTPTETNMRTPCWFRWIDCKQITLTSSLKPFGGNWAYCRPLKSSPRYHLTVKGSRMSCFLGPELSYGS